MTTALILNSNGPLAPAGRLVQLSIALLFTLFFIHPPFSLYVVPWKAQEIKKGGEAPHLPTQGPKSNKREAEETPESQQLKKLRNGGFCGSFGLRSLAPEPVHPGETPLPQIPVPVDKRSRMLRQQPEAPPRCRSSRSAAMASARRSEPPFSKNPSPASTIVSASSSSSSIDIWEQSRRHAFQLECSLLL
uniref:Uncharacterized protein LOC114914860 n=1 Tax=Elaeis guineensis var. tenera TaxID=51953 RepID=A0A8N4F5S5_ELAGV|nr:uncharacterized protein LOC114914860 [Elaeis guineensis]